MLILEYKMDILRKFHNLNLRKKKEKCTAFLFSKRKIRAEEKTAYLEMHIANDGRRLVLLAALLSSAGYAVAVYLSNRDFFHLDRIAVRFFLCNKSVFRISTKKNIETCAVLLSDREETLREYRENGGSGRTLFIDYIFKSGQETYRFADGLFYPIHFHPAYLNSGTERKILALRNAEKDIAVFFAGNVSPEYCRFSVRKVNGHPVNDRMEIFHFLNTQCMDFIFLPESLQDLQEKMYTGALKNKVVLVDINNWKIPPEFYFQILSRSAYFLYLPGFLQPYCHNMYESLACGCIPVLQFPEIFSPAFADGKNAVVYFSLQELKEKLERIISSPLFQTDGNRTQELQRNVIEYYDRFSSFSSFAMGLESGAEKLYTLPSVADTVAQN